MPITSLGGITVAMELGPTDRVKADRRVLWKIGAWKGRELKRHFGKGDLFKHAHSGLPLFFFSFFFYVCKTGKEHSSSWRSRHSLLFFSVAAQLGYPLTVVL